MASLSNLFEAIQEFKHYDHLENDFDFQNHFLNDVFLDNLQQNDLNFTFEIDFKILSEDEENFLIEF